MAVAVLLAASLLWSSKHLGTFRATVLGVHTSVLLRQDDSALVSVSGLGFTKSGVAHLVGDDFRFDEAFDEFLRSRRVRILGLVDRTQKFIVIRVGLPLFGRITIRLSREVNL